MPYYIKAIDCMADSMSLKQASVRTEHSKNGRNGINAGSFRCNSK